MADDDKKKDLAIPYGGGREANPEDWDNEPVALAIERARLAAQVEPHHQDGPVVNQAHDAVDTTAQLWPKIKETGYKVSIPKVVEDNKQDAEYIREAIHNPSVPQSWKAGPDQSPIVKAAVEALLKAHKGVEDYDKSVGGVPAKGTNGMSPRDTAVAKAYPAARELAHDYYTWAKDLVGSKKKP